MMRTTKAIIKTLTLFFVALLVTRTAFTSGLVQAGIETSNGEALYIALRHFFNVAGAEEGETLIMSVIFCLSLFLVTLSAWLLSKFWTRTKHNSSK
ncbi:hypothetical protein [Pseudomonas savastanoi]|uniref:Uncharacterized protein n=2 Tax=Pseudomonas savastanoi pv. glycinea TaxID=318 RepID=A0A0P9RNE8_PSESG|nr:hypothetical protein [Pseudomonas savastanoi]EFW77384.1 hypothetical protein PsgB076_28810 [Pseudomonas savastanoi pv. glycinea str. B076]EFW87154.1 hypothetical protein PsgRace4_04646 [Pseudomonas savastanoi pv. glycinea str. race 4]EGH17023.1 hypothetical protein Pgy4_28820 [Pseudomonas savastanoi pv. glycinea str. race 4]KPX49572.1 hypothetical protein ALO37_200007 [Pseudomonas savastanoi pv. glycinea]MCQ3008623.1 hypothetical protein [Pseudomonas savastanoi]